MKGISVRLGMGEGVGSTLKIQVSDCQAALLGVVCDHGQTPEN